MIISFHSIKLVDNTTIVMVASIAAAVGITVVVSNIVVVADSISAAVVAVDIVVVEHS